VSALGAAVGRGRLVAPDWWRRGTRTPLWWAAIVVWVVLTVADVGWGSGRTPGVWGAPGVLALYVFSSLLETVLGLLFWMWRPRNLLGPLLYLWPLWMSEIPDLALVFPHSRLAASILDYGGWLAYGIYVHMLFAFPSGRLYSRRVLPIVVWYYVMVTAWNVPVVLFDGLGAEAPVSKTPSPYGYLGHGWSYLHAWVNGREMVAIATTLVVDGFLAVRLWRASPGARRRIGPLYAQWFTFWNFAIIYHSLAVILDGPALGAWWAYVSQLYPLSSAVGAWFGLATVRRARGSVADLVVELGEVEPGQVRVALARSLGDPGLTLGLWLPDRQEWVDEQGTRLELPSDGSRALTYVGEGLAVMVHDRDLLDQPRLLEAVGSAGRLALENGRLQAELRVQLLELRASRARIVRAADEERRRLERDLHDGAQQRLLGLGMGLQLLAGHLGEGGQELLEEVQRELDEALRELRELARGIHPAVLTDQGLDAAVRTLAQRAPVPVMVSTDGERPPVHVETAAYFVVSEALANIAKYARASRASVALARENGDLRVEVADDGVGGASLGTGSGLTGLADRVGALGGRLSLESPPGGGTRLRAVIPCS
jgi:signal transduction histidine kinase